MNDLKSGEPFFGRWYIKDFIELPISGSVYLMYCMENGVYEYSAMKVISVPSEKLESKQVQSQEFDHDSAVQYYKELVTDMYREICLMEKLNDKSHLISYEEHMIFQRENDIGYDVFLRMEYLPSITQGVQISTLSRKEIIQLGKDICQALRICEIYHIVHGSVCPETIFVTSDGSFKLGGFSFARYSKLEEVNITEDNFFDYMAPEVYEGKAYDNRSDIYSLGLVLYMYLNDYKLPYLNVLHKEATKKERLEAMKRRFESQVLPKPLHATQELANVIGKACELNPKQRYQSADEFKDALTSIGVFLDADLIDLVEDHSFTPDEIYVKNEVVVNPIKEVEVKSVEVEVKPLKDIVINPIEVLLKPVEKVMLKPVESESVNSIEKVLVDPVERERRFKRKQEKIKEQAGKNMRTWMLLFLVLVLSATVIVLLTKVDFTSQEGSSAVVETSSELPTFAVTLTPSMDGAKELTETPTVVPTLPPQEEPTVVPTQNLQEEPTVVPTIEPEPTFDPMDEYSLTSIVISGENLTDLTKVHGFDTAIAIDLSNNKLTEIEDLNIATQAETLVLSQNFIANVEPLQALTNLKALDISNNYITTFSKLGNLENLEVLSAHNNSITSLEGLEKLTSLRILYLNDNFIQDITVLKKMISLEIIDLSNNKVKEKDLKALKKALPECIIVY